LNQIDHFCSLVCEHGEHFLRSSLFAQGKANLLESEPLFAFRVGLDENGFLLDDLADWSLLSGRLCCSYWIFLDCLVCSLVIVLERLALELLLPLAELSLEGFRIILLNQIVVLLDMDT